jgi:protein O-mannosyl-transferase
MNLPISPGMENAKLQRLANGQDPLLAKVAAGLILITFFIFLPVVESEFINYDDDIFVTDNPKVASGLTWDGVKWAFTSADIDYWRPLSWVSHMLDIELFGAMAGGHHLTSLLIHCAGVGMAFLALNKLSGALWPSAWVAALFAWHPLHVESVAWVAERKDVLCGFFWFLTLWLYGEHVTRPNRHSYLMVFGGFVLAIMSKPMAVTLPCVLLLLDFWPLGRLNVLRSDAWSKENREASAKACWFSVREKLPMFCIIAVLSLSTIQSQHQVGTLSNLSQLPISIRLENAVNAYATYLSQTVFPAKLCLIYPIAPIPFNRVVISCLLIAMISCFAMIRLSRSPWLLIGWLWFLGVLFPVVGIMQVGEQAHADRYTYLPLVGISIAIVWSLARVASNRPELRLWVTCLGMVGLTVCAIITRNQTRLWASSAQIFEHTALHTVNNVSALNNWASDLITQKRPLEAAAILQLALRARLEQMPWMNLSTAYFLLGRNDRGYAAMMEAISMNPRSKEMDGLLQQIQSSIANGKDSIHNHRQAAAILMARRDYENALKHMREVAQSLPTDADVKIDLATYLAVAGHVQEARGELEKALLLSPSNPIAHSNLAALLARAGLNEAAKHHFTAAINADPENLDSKHNFALFLLRTGQIDQARDQFEAVLAKNSTHLPAAQQLAWLLASRPELRDGVRAMALARQVLDRTSNPAAAHHDLMGAAAAAAGRFEDAALHATEAVRLAQQERNASLASAARSRLLLYLKKEVYVEGQ